MAKILMVGGGSAGHLAPLLAVGEAVMNQGPHELLYVCSQKESDALFLHEAGVNYKTLIAPRRGLMLPLELFRAQRDAKKIIDAFQPDVVFSKGGSVSVMLCKVAHQKNIPVVVHESDAVMGTANAIVAKFADHICLGFAPTHDSRLTTHSSFTGNPIRNIVKSGSREKGFEITQLSPDRPVFLIIGGSQGAQALNEAVYANLDALLALTQVIHITGPGKNQHIVRDGYWSIDFAREELPHLYACASLALTRAGANIITELAAHHVPLLICPIEGLANNHQVANAMRAQERGACILVRQSELDKKLVVHVSEIVRDEAKRTKMSQSVASLYQQDAAVHIAKKVLQCVARDNKHV